MTKYLNSSAYVITVSFFFSVFPCSFLRYIYIDVMPFCTVAYKSLPLLFGLLFGAFLRKAAARKSQRDSSHSLPWRNRRQSVYMLNAFGLFQCISLFQVTIQRI